MAGFSDITGVSIKGGCYTDPNGQPSQLKHIFEKWEKHLGTRSIRICPSQSQWERV